MEHAYGSAFFFDENVYAPSSPPRQPGVKPKCTPRIIENNRFRNQQQQSKTMLGVVPLMSFYPNRTNPREDLVKRVRAIITKGIMSQKRIAEEIGLRLVDYFTNKEYSSKDSNYNLSPIIFAFSHYQE